jgi:hypothetical protein
MASGLMGDLDFPAQTFDAASIRWGLMFMPEPVECLRSTPLRLLQARPASSRSPTRRDCARGLLQVRSNRQLRQWTTASGPTL